MCVNKYIYKGNVVQAVYGVRRDEYEHCTLLQLITDFSDMNELYITNIYIHIIYILVS